MSKLLTIAAIAFLCIVNVSCSKTGGGSGGAPITDEETAKAVFLKINSLWTATLKPALTKEAQIYTDKTLDGGTSGKAIVNGKFAKTSFSSSTSSSNTSEVDVTITFQQYETGGLRLDGVLRFFDSYSYRQSCGSSGCASSTKTSTGYFSANGSGTTFSPVTAAFNYNGKDLRDGILLTASKEYAHWAVKVTNGSNKVFSFSY